MSASLFVVIASCFCVLFSSCKDSSPNQSDTNQSTDGQETSAKNNPNSAQNTDNATDTRGNSADSSRVNDGDTEPGLAPKDTALGDDASKDITCNPGFEGCECFVDMHGDSICDDELECIEGICVAVPCDLGQERCDCHEDGSCDDGLICLSGLCVDPGGINENDTTQGTADGENQDITDSEEMKDCLYTCVVTLSDCYSINGVPEEELFCSSGICCRFGNDTEMAQNTGDRDLEYQQDPDTCPWECMVNIADCFNLSGIISNEYTCRSGVCCNTTSQSNDTEAFDTGFDTVRNDAGVENLEDNCSGVCLASCDGNWVQDLTGTCALSGGICCVLDNTAD